MNQVLFDPRKRGAANDDDDDDIEMNEIPLISLN